MHKGQDQVNFVEVYVGVIYVGRLPFARQRQYIPFTSTEYAF